MGGPYNISAVGLAFSGLDKRTQRRSQEDEEEFFCLSTEDVRATPSITEGPRTGNSSSASSQPRSRHTSTSSRPVEMVTAETKIFSVAVQAGKTEGSASRNPPLRDVEGQMVDRPVILNSKARERHCSDDEFKPAQREALEQPEVEPVPEETFVIEEKAQEEQPVVAETKKQKKNKK